MTDNRYGDKPLGKSVEEVENEVGNRVNSPVPGEARRDEEADAAFVPAVVGGGGQSTGAVPVIVSSGGLVEEGGGAARRDDPAERRSNDEEQVHAPIPDRDRGTSER